MRIVPAPTWIVGAVPIARLWAEMCAHRREVGRCVGAVEGDLEDADAIGGQVVDEREESGARLDAAQDGDEPRRADRDGDGSRTKLQRIDRHDRSIDSAQMCVNRSNERKDRSRMLGYDAARAGVAQMAERQPSKFWVLYQIPILVDSAIAASTRT